MNPNGAPATTRNLLMGMVLLGALVLWLLAASLQDPLSSYRARYTVRLPDVSGLAVGNPVRVRGDIRGAVAALNVVDGQAELTLRLDAALDLRDGAAVRIRAKTMLGGRYLELIPGDPAAPPLTPSSRLTVAVLPVMPETLHDTFEQISGETAPLALVQEASRALATLGTLRTRLDRLPRLTDDLRRLTAGLAPLLRDLDRLLSHREDIPDAYIQRVDILSDRVHRIHERLSDIAVVCEMAGNAFDGRLGGHAAELGESLEHLGAALGRSGTVFARLDGALTGFLRFDERLLRALLQAEGLSPLSPRAASRVRARIRELEQTRQPSSEVSP